MKQAACFPANYIRGDIVAKKGMTRPDWTHTHPRNEVSPVPELQGRAKHSKKPAAPIVAGTGGAEQKVWHHPPECKGHR